VLLLKLLMLCWIYFMLCAVLQGLNQDMRQHDSTFAAEHLRMMANRNCLLENKVTVETINRWRFAEGPV